jgi:predicted Zn finger-like uncharacterized protein
MFTVCPKCALTLVVTAADLRVAQGYVRCGRCSSVFNALARLTEERQGGAAAEPGTVTEAEAAAAEAAAPPPPGAPPEEPPETALEFDPATTDVNSVFVQPPPDPQWTAATGSFKALVAANQEAAAPELTDSQVDVEIDAAFLASMLRAENGAPEAAPVHPPTAAAVAPAPQPAAPAADAHDVPPPRAATAAAKRAPAAAKAAAAPAPARARAPLFDKSDPEGLGLEVKEERFARAAQAAPDAPRASDSAEHPEGAVARVRAHAWSIGAALAALVLLAQIVNHDRDELAANPRFNRPLTSLYSLLGVKLFPRWDLRAYDVRQLGASAASSGAGVITVRASIKNAAPQPQPLPLLRVTLQDRFGNRIAARDVQPQAYLPGLIPPSSFLSAGQRIDAEMGFADPGADAVGFEIDACLPARGGGIACANDVTLR